MGQSRYSRVARAMGPKHRGQADPIDDLTNEHWRMIGPQDKIVSIPNSPDELEPDRDIVGL